MPTSLRTLSMSLAAVMLATLTSAVNAAPVAPSLELIAPNENVVVYRYPGEPIYLDLGVFVAATGAPFELRLSRPDYTQPVVLQQVIVDPDGGASDLRTLPSDLLDGWNGLAGFLDVTFVNGNGVEVASLSSTFCPNSYERERVSDDGPALSTYPDSCFANPFTKGMVWGLAEDWAVNPFSFYGSTVTLRKGHYTANVSIADTYVDLFDIDPAQASASIAVEVRNYETEECIDCPVGGSHASASDRRVPASSRAVPTMEDPEPGLLPDLVALPAWGFSVENRRKRSFLNFGATVWTAGAQSLVVEGFRRDGEEVMDAYQYFYANGEAVGRDQVGEMEFDDRDGHSHWHFLQFAKYSLLATPDTEEIVSKKEAFCLAPTDAIDLTLPGVDLAPTLGLSTACGRPTSIWVREILPLGWGDTYIQGLPGQSFNITGLPNGTYYVAVEANPTGLLHEQTSDNNVELREIHLKGKAGARRVEVPLWNGIDTETQYGGTPIDH